MERIEEYLSSVYKAGVKVSRVSVMGGGTDLKGFGYGLPYLIEFSVDGVVKCVVLETMREEGLGMNISLIVPGLYSGSTRRSTSCLGT